MAESFKLRVGNLFPEFLAHAFGIGCLFQTAGTVTASTFEAIANHFHDFLVFIKPDHTV